LNSATQEDDDTLLPQQNVDHINDNIRIDISDETAEYVGDSIMRIDTDKILRIGFININGLPQTKEDPKNKMIFNSIKNKQFGIVGMAELNKCWYLVNEEDKWKERTRGWWEAAHHNLSYNRRDGELATTFQPGGTAVLSVDTSSHRIIQSGQDPKGLGRWAWTLFRGKHDITLRVISMYRPCKPSSPGPNTAFSQQQRFLNRTSDTRCPREAVLEDLGRYIDQWRQDGDQIILGGDFNEDVTNMHIRQWCQRHQLTNAIGSKYNIHGEATYHRGTHSIDAILVSHTIHPIKMGYLPFGSFPSDHRCIWIDISLENAFGYKPPRSSRPSARRLKSDNPQVRNRWLKVYEDFIRSHSLHTRQFQLEATITTPMSPDQITEYEYIRQKRLEGIELADLKCRKLCMGNVPFSAKYQRLTARIELWKAVIKKKRHCKYSQSKLRRLERTTGIKDSLHCSLEQAKENEKIAYSDYWKFKKHATEERETFLEDKAKEIAKESGSKKANIIKQLITREKQREASRRIKCTLHKIKNSGISKVDVETATGGTIEITTKAGIENACMQENRNKFLQTRNTPCMREPLRSALGHIGETEVCKEILRGTYNPPPHTPIYTRELLTQLNKPQAFISPPPSAQVTTSMFQEGWKKMNEYTSSGISGIHFGHMKSCAFNDFISNFESSISHIPFATGYSPDDWKKGIDVMIQKKERINLVTKLRTITLTEADFNFNNKILGKETLQHAELNNMIAKEQYGSRKGKSAIEHAIHKRLTFDIMRQMRYNGALCSNDAKSCYDRILHSIASLAYQRLGIPFPPVQCMLHSIQNMKHHIRTSFGDSYFTMQNETLIPFQGMLQGNGASPATWVIISSPLLDMLRDAGNGAFFIEPISKKSSHLVGYAFVDDTDLVQFDLRDPQETEEEMLDKMQDAISRWEGGLKATGGAIVPQKSFVYPVIFDFDAAGVWHYRKAEDIEYQFTVPDCDNNIQHLELLDSSDGRCTLGVHLAPDGTNDSAIQHLRRKAEVWRDYIKTGHLTKKDAWLATETTIMRSLLYPLPALTLTEKECNHIIAPVLEAGLQSSSICKNYPRAVTYGPKEESGLNLPNLYVQQGLQRIAMITDHLSSHDMMGELLRTSIEAAKVEIGVGRNLFSLDYSLYSTILTDSWVKSTWQFAREYNIDIIDKVTSNLPLHRQNDVFLMEVICHHGFSKSELQKINRCRLHLQVSSLSDISCGYGTRYTNAYNCIYDHTIPHHHLWPKQPRPNAASISIWRRALRLCFPREGGLMTHTLGNWLYRPSTEWRWFFYPRSQLIYQRHGASWRIWRRRHRAGNLGQTPTFQYETNGMLLPVNSVRATIIRIGATMLRMTGWSNHIDTQPFEFSEHSNTSWILNQADRPPQVNAIKNSIQMGTALAVSDGSFLDENNIGSAGWLIEDCNQIQILQGKLESPGDSNAQCSHRSELAGILGVITHIHKICSQHDIHNGSVTVCCDGIGAIQRICSGGLSRSSHKHFDIINSIKLSIRHSPLHWRFKHVKGHQDDVQHFDDLDRAAQLNTLADSLAKNKLNLLLQQEPRLRRRPQHLPYEQIEIYWTDNRFKRSKISSCMVKTLTHHIQTSIIRKYWIKKRKFSNYTATFIDWDSSKRSRLGLDKSRQKWLSKWMTGFCGVGKMLQRYRHQKHSKCPRCLSDNETVHHVLQCTHDEAKHIWNQSLENLETWMTNNHGHPELIELIILCLNKWHDQELIPYDYDILEPSLVQAYKQQRRLGWASFIEGYWSSYWRHCQSDYLKGLQSRKSSLLWISRVQRRIWLIAWELWEHRNSQLHNKGNTIHSYEMQELDIEIRNEWGSGLDQLPQTYTHLFDGSLENRITDNVHQKLMWLISVWTARDNEIHVGPMRQRSSTILTIYDRWKKKNNNE
jgi:hypothetical protein